MSTNTVQFDTRREARKSATARHQQQGELLDDRYLHKQTIESKLIGIASGNQVLNFVRCGNEEIFSTCRGCGKVERFFYACNRKWCPLCVQKLSRLRAQKLKLWSNTIRQPKHLVLTMRNFEVLTGKRIREFQQALLKLRRLKLFKEVKGGCASLEITKGNEGWHLHAHLLLDVRWLDMENLARQWGGLVNQQFGIVKIKDLRESSYLQEVTKYVAKGSEIASWPGEQIWEFVCAIKGRRFFFAFGSLFKMSGEIKREIARQAAGNKPCTCGACDFIYESEAQDAENQIKRSRGIHRRNR